MPDSKIMEATLVVDIGNTNIVCAVFDRGEKIASSRILSIPPLSKEEYLSRLGILFPEYPFVLFKYIVVASVVPSITKVWQEISLDYPGQCFHFITGLSTLGLKYNITNRAIVGADLVANAFAAWKGYSGSSLVVDLGTATTIQLVTDQGLYAGVVIAPGMKTAASQLIQKAAQLEEFSLVAPDEVIGNNTIDALRSGIVLGHALMIQSFIAKISEEYPQYAPYTVILTGGLASTIAPLCPSDYILDSDLTINGLFLAACHLAGESE